MNSYLFTCVFRELLRRKSRTGITITGYILAVLGALILSVFLIATHEKTSGILRSTGTHLMVFQAGCGLKDCSIVLRGDKSEGLEINGIQTVLLTPEKLTKVRNISSVKDASLYLGFRFKDSLHNTFISVGGFDISTSGAVSTNCCAATDVIKGRFLTATDSSAIMIHEAFARTKKLFVNDTVLIANRKFPIIGIINPGVRPANADVYINIKSLYSLMQTRISTPTLTNQGNAILIEVKSSLLQQNLLTELKRMGFTYSSYNCYKPAANVWMLEQTMAWLFLSILCVGAVLFALKSQLASINERRQEISILRTLGWQKTVILKLIVFEVLIQAWIGYFVGLFLSYGTLLTVRDFYARQHNLYFSTATITGCAFIIFILITFGGFTAGLLSGAKASGLRPAENFRKL